MSVHLAVHPLLILQAFMAVLVVLTLPDIGRARQPEETSASPQRKTFELSDGNTYVEHAGMAVEVHWIQSLNITG